MIAPNACGGKGFAEGNMAQPGCAKSPSTGSRHHAFVKQFIERPDFGRGRVNLVCDNATIEFGSVRVPDSSAPPAPRSLYRPALIVPCRFNPLRFGPAQAGPFFRVRAVAS